VVLHLSGNLSKKIVWLHLISVSDSVMNYSHNFVISFEYGLDVALTDIYYITDICFQHICRCHVCLFQKSFLCCLLLLLYHNNNNNLFYDNNTFNGDHRI